MATNSVFDPLASCLIRIARENEIHITQEGILSGLPQKLGRLTPLHFARAAERIGLSSNMVQQPIQQINIHILPAILLLKDNKVCILYELNLQAQQAMVYFPELGDTVSQVSLEVLQADYLGTVIYVQQRQFIVDNKVKLEKSDQHWFWGVIRDNRKIYKDILLTALVVNLFALIMPLFIMNIYDRVVPNHAIETLWVLSLGIFVVLTADFALKLIRSYFLDLASSRSDQKLSAYIMEKVLGRRMENEAPVGVTAANIQSFESIRSFCSSLTLISLIDFPFFFLFLIVIGMIAWQFIVPILIGSFIILLYGLSVHLQLKQLSEAMTEASQQRNSFLIESLTASETIKSFNASSRTQTVWEKASAFVIHYSSRLRFLGGTVASFAGWIQQTIGVVIIIMGVYLIIDGQLSQGALIACYMLAVRATAPIAQAAGLLTQYYQASSALKSLNQMVAAEQEREQLKGWVSHPHISGDIELKNVSLRYAEDAHLALDSVSFHIKAGEKVAILGQIGSGKSSIQKLLLALYKPTEGTVSIDGTHISQIDPAELRSNIGYIPQDIHLLNGTVLSNITLGNPHIQRDALEQSLIVSGLVRVLKAHKDGLSMQVGEAGSHLSGGQRQAVAVARAIAQQANILLFDEPTSAMDAALENQVIHNLKQYMSAQQTLILVTHKPSLLHLVDRIIVMEDGKVIADGPKDTVLTTIMPKQRKEGAEA